MRICQGGYWYFSDKKYAIILDNGAGMYYNGIIKEGFL